MALAEVKRYAGKNYSTQKTFGDKSQAIDDENLAIFECSYYLQSDS